MQLALLAPYNNLATSVAAALVPTLLAPHLHRPESVEVQQKKPSVSASSLSKPSTSSADFIEVSKCTPSNIEGSPSTSQRNSVLKMSSNKKAELAEVVSPEGSRLKKNLSWGTEESIASDITKISLKKKKTEEENFGNEDHAETTLLPQDPEEGVTLHTILNHIAYVNRAAGGGLADSYPTPASRKQQVAAVLRVTYATALLGLALCFANFFQLFGPYGLCRSGEIRPWPWFCFQTLCRAVELAMGCAMANITKQPVTQRHQQYFAYSMRVKQRESLFM